MRTETRYDVGTIRSARLNAQGFLILDGHASRVGVQKYRLADGSVRRELRLPEDVQAQKSLDGFEGIVVTDDHPSEMVTARNARRYQAGFVQGPGVADGDLVKIGIVITDAALIDKVQKQNKRQLSVGYNVDLEMTAGVHPVYGEYDAIQRNIRPNHQAVVDEGRAGPRASLHLDAEGRADASIAVSVDHEWQWASLSVYSDTLSSDALVERVRQLLAGFEGLQISVSEYAGDDADLRVSCVSGACAWIRSRDMSAADMRQKIQPLLEGDGGMQMGSPQVTANDRAARNLHLAGVVPASVNNDASRSKHVNLEQALQALNDTNVKLGAATARADQAERATLASEQARKDAESARAVAEAKAEQSRKDAEAEKAAAEQARKDADAKVAEANAKAEQARKDAEAGSETAVADRVDALTNAALILGPETKDAPRAKMTTREIKVAIVKHVDNDDVDEKAIPAVVDVQYAGAVKRHGKGAASIAGTRQVIQQQRDESPKIDGRAAEATARDKNRDDISSGWMKPTTASKKEGQ